MIARYIRFSAIAAIAVAAFAVFYRKYLSVTDIAAFNFPDFTVEKFIRSNNNPFVKITPVSLDDTGTLSSYDVILVRIHGSSLTAEHFDAIRKAAEKGRIVFSTESDNAEINTLKDSALAYVSELMDNGCAANYRSLFNFLRSEAEGKIIYRGTYSEPVKVPDNYFFHLGEDEFFATYEEYDRFYRSSGKYKDGAPRVVLLAGNINMQNSNEEHFAALVDGLEKRGMNVYPVNSFGMEKLGMIASVRPDIVINRPHGRLVMGGGESGTALLKKMNVPLLAPVTVSRLYDEWIEDVQGMSGGGMTSMSVVLPELDGAIAPFAVAAQFERNGMKIFDAIPGHTDKFCNLVCNFAKLRTKPASEKRIALYYYKGTGKAAVNAADIEGVQSLYNTLKMLSEAGYNVDGLPSSAEKLEKMIQTSGSVLGPYALGAYDRFLKDGNPVLMPVDSFNVLVSGILPSTLIESLEASYGKAPGDYMSCEKDGKEYMAVAALRFGNIAILPQPMASVGDDVEKIIHGQDGAPAYPYIASYLWTRKVFNADALIHFGTHGSLEFIPGKQVALSDYDWTDAIIGDVPHFYIYTINNIGEGIIAKRRSYATLITHLTAPFMQSGLYDNLRMLKDRIHRMEGMEEGEIKDNYRVSITGLAKKENLFSVLSIDSTKVLDDAGIEKIHHYLEEVDGAKVGDGLYTLGVPYTKEQLSNTARLMSLDPVRYALASIDAAHGKMDRDRMDDPSYMSHHYTPVAQKAISELLSGVSAADVFNRLVSAADRKLFEEHVAAKKTEGGRMMTAGTDMSAMASMMDRMSKAEPMADEGTVVGQDGLMDAIESLYSSLENVRSSYDNLKKSTGMEADALLDALAGGYVEPCSAGDPVVNPAAVPTGRNFYSINPEATPSPEAWKTGRRLAESLLESEFSANGKYPEKVSFTLWSTDFISSEGATVAQILYLLGVEPLRDGFGYIRSLRLIPAEKLGRPRIDVVIQTSGQLRDIAASRLALLNQAIQMAASDDSDDNYVRKGFTDAEKLLLEKGFSPVDARKYSKERIFGGAGGNYGTGIMGMVEKGDSWESADEIAERYISNMGAVYSADGGEGWGEMREGVFEAALLNTSVVVQPRSSNTWGPLSLDHVYEFMGGLSASVKHVTGNDPSAYFNDFRNTSRARVQGLKEAIGVEAGSTLFNPKYISHMMEGEASAMEHFAESFRNTYGWNVMKPSVVDDHIWDRYYDIYVKDEYGMGVKEKFVSKNPYALQEMTAVMLESARKGMWKADPEQLKNVAELHAELVSNHQAGCSGFVCDNGKLKDFISSKLGENAAERYEDAVKSAREVVLENQDIENNVVLRKEERRTDRKSSAVQEENSYTILYILGSVLVIGILWVALKRRK